MEQTKPQRRTNIFDHWNLTKKQKITEESNTMKKPITCFENLSNELFYEIFNYLDVYHVYRSFYNLNLRLQSLLTHSNLPLKINLSSITKSNFQRYNRHIIMPNKHRIISLHVSNPFIIDLIFSPIRIISNFIRLETLIFDNIKPKYLINVLNHLSYLSNLSSLIIISMGHFGNPTDLYLQIFRLPALKYCKISLDKSSASYSLPQATNVTSPIEHLVINNNFSLNHLNCLLSYIPNLRRLSIDNLVRAYNLQEELNLTKLNNLTHVVFNIININFDQFQLISKYLFTQLEVLHLSVDNDQTYLNANRWEQLILVSIPKLRIFDFQYTNILQNDNDNNQLKYNDVIQQFSSLFWVARKWFFSYQFYPDEYQNRVILYSRDPYRRKQYTLNKQLIKNTHLRHQKRNMNFVDHVNIRNEEAITNCNYYFQNTTKLTLSNSFHESRTWFSIILKQIIPLKQLTILVIDSNELCFEQLIKLLNSAPNIHALTLNCQSITKENSKSIQESEIFRLVSNKNIIRNVIITEKYSLENIKLLVALCPRMQHFTINIQTRYLESIVEFILKNNNKYLCLLCMKNTIKSIVETLKSLIESEELLDNYLIKLIGSDLYIWC